MWSEKILPLAARPLPNLSPMTWRYRSPPSVMLPGAGQAQSSNPGYADDECSQPVEKLITGHRSQECKPQKASNRNQPTFPESLAARLTLRCRYALNSQFSIVLCRRSRNRLFSALPVCQEQQDRLVSLARYLRYETEREDIRGQPEIVFRARDSGKCEEPQTEDGPVFPGRAGRSPTKGCFQIRT